MQSVDVNQSSNEIKGGINAIKTYTELSKSAKELKKSAGNSLSKASSDITTQLNKISEQQKRFQREVPTSADQLLDFIGLTSGTGSETTREIRKKILEAAVKIQPQIQEIIRRNAIKALGCSQEQTYIGIDPIQLQQIPLPLQPIDQGIYIPIPSIDIQYALKQDLDSRTGRIFYEKDDPLKKFNYIPYDGLEPFPMNKMLKLLLENQGQSYNQIIGGLNYQGSSLKDIFDIQYTTVNQYGVTGDYFRVMLINRTDQNGQPANQVGNLLSDYYSTIELIDPAMIAAQLINSMLGTLSVNFGTGQIQDQNRFEKILSRILGLCFDSRREIDVSGVSKIAELDGVDDSFFELNEVDLRNIDVEISNIQNGVVEFVDCGNIKLPVDHDTLLDELINFRDSLSGQTDEENVATIEKIIDSISQNPEWQDPQSNLLIKTSIDKSAIKKIPLAIVSGVLTPKVLLPIFTLLAVVQNEKDSTYSQAITDVNQFVGSANTLSNQTSNVVTNGVDFLNKFRTFSIQVVSEIGAIFLKTLFDILKRDIINLIGIVLKDVVNSKTKKKLRIILRYVKIAVAVAQLVSDYRKCKNLLDDIIQLLRLINQVIPIPKPEIPPPLLALTPLLPGTSPERSTINTIELLQSYGIPTGPMPDGSPNLMTLFVYAVDQGIDKEIAENGKVEILTAAGIPGYGKFF